MANNVQAPKAASSSALAQAKDKPSKVLVPRPTSSINTKLCAVALCKILAVSVISTIKVERPEARSSDAPMRVKMRSIGPILAALAGTAEPICANKTIKATWRIKVDLPPMLGPVIISIRVAGSKIKSLATKGLLTTCSTTG